MRVYEMTAQVSSISRGKGRSATACAAYRACAVIACEREQKTHDYTRKGGLEASGIVLPAEAPAWAADRAKLWNAAELRERNGARGKNAGQFKADAVVAREFLFGFPAELSAAGRLRVTHAVAKHLADSHGIAADFSIHHPGKDGDQRNFHCHMMTTTRRMTAKGLGEKTREWDDLYGGARLTKAFRAFLATTMNDALAAEGKAELVHVEHLSFEERGSGQRPTRHQGPVKTNTERKGRRVARDDWRKALRVEQTDRQTKERAALKTRHDFELAARTGHLAERERTGMAAIRDALKAEQAADVAPKGFSRMFQVMTGKAMRADFDRQARAAARTEAAEQQIAALKASVQAERNSFALNQTKEAQTLAAKHQAEDRQLDQAVNARADRDRVFEVQARQNEFRPIRRERLGHEIERGLSP